MELKSGHAVDPPPSSPSNTMHGKAEANPGRGGQSLELVTDLPRRCKSVLHCVPHGSLTFMDGGYLPIEQLWFAASEQPPQGRLARVNKATLLDHLGIG